MKEDEEVECYVAEDTSSDFQDNFEAFVRNDYESLKNLREYLISKYKVKNKKETTR